MFRGLGLVLGNEIRRAAAALSGYLLLESGDFFLLEDGISKILLEGSASVLTGFHLLEDGASFILLEDGTSKLGFEGN